MSSRIIPVIMCGGAGTRLWPASRESLPKQFIPLFAERSTFQETMLRVARDDIFEKPIVLTSAEFRFIVAEQLQQTGIKADIVLEPARRDSGPAVAAATALGLKRATDATILILASDHAMTKVEQFHVACREAWPIAQQGLIVTFGIIPTEPATVYGYLKPGDVLSGSAVRKLEAFAEKPDRAAAEGYISQGDLWNSGNFLFRADAMKAELERLAPDIWRAAEQAVGAASADPDFFRLSADHFTRAPKISIDYAVMEKTTRSAVLPVDFGWSDLGTWDAVWANAPRDADGNALSGPVEAVNVSNALVLSDPNVLTSVIGLSDIAVVVTADAVLIAPRTATGEIKTLVERLKAEGRTQATEHRKSNQPVSR